MRPVPQAPEYRPDPDLPVDIAYSDNAVLIADKPSGLLSVPGRGPDLQDCLQSRLSTIYGPLFAPHRLDMDTSGLTVFARTPKALRALSEQFRTSDITKHYLARVEGLVQGDTGRIDLPIGRDWSERPKRRIDEENGKPSLTLWRCLSRNDESSLVELSPQTGRTHQLRVHCAAIGHPILGDRLYGHQASTERLMLHASALSFKHPETGGLIDISSAVPFG